MDLYRVALEEIAYEGLEGVTLSGLWECFKKRLPPIDCAIDQWTKPHIWKRLVQSEYVRFYHIDFDGPKAPDVKINKAERFPKLPNQFWVYNYLDGTTGYSTSFYYRADVTPIIHSEENMMSLDEADKKYGDNLVIVAVQEYRRRLLYGQCNPPLIEEMVPLRYIMLEIIAKVRWAGFMQVDFHKIYGLDPRTSFHHIKVLLKLHLITKQNIVVSSPVTDAVTTVPPKATKMLHLVQFSNVFTTNVRKAAAKICSILEEAPCQTMERSELRSAFGDTRQFKKMRQWLFQNGYINYVVNGELWNSETGDTSQLAHIRSSRPCYVCLIKKFQHTEGDDDKDDDLMDYIENCDDIEPQLVFEESMHRQAYCVLLACRENGITMKKLAEVMCIPYTMSRSLIRYLDTRKLGRIINVDHMKQKLQKIVAIQFLHQSETVKKIQTNKLKMEQHRALTLDEKPKTDETKSAMVDPNSSLMESNNELADRIGFTCVSQRSNISLRHMERKNMILDFLKVHPVYEGVNQIYKKIIAHEETQRHTHGICCRKTIKKIIKILENEGQIRTYTAEIDRKCVPPLTAMFCCAAHVTEESQEFLDVLSAARSRHEGQEKRKEMRNAVRSGKKKVTEVKTEAENFIKTEMKDEVEENGLTDTDDEDFDKKTKSMKAYMDQGSRFTMYGRFQRLHILHLYLWMLVYGTDDDLKTLKAASSGSVEYSDLIQSRHIWLQKVNGLPKYKQGPGWFNIRDVISLMPLDVTCRILGIRCWSDTVLKYLQDSEKRLLRMTDLPPRLKYKLLMSPANRQHLDITVDLLVLLAQMGLIAISSENYPKIRSEIMLFVRKEAKITDTRLTEKTYCQTILPEGLDTFPVNVYSFKCLDDVEKYWTDLQFVCLNTPLGLNRVERTQSSKTKNADDEGLGRSGVGRTSAKITGRVLRSFTVLKDFVQYYENKDFSNMEPVVFGNNLGAGGLDSIFFGHLAKNWQCAKKPKKAANANGKSLPVEKASSVAITNKTEPTKLGKKIMVSSEIIRNRAGGKGLKRKLANASNVLTKKMKLERKRQFDKMIAKRFEHVRERVRLNEIKKKTMRKNKRELSALNHDDTDRAALKRMKGQRVSFTEREDAHIMLAEIVRAMMKLHDKGQPLEKKHPKIFWRAIRDLLHKEVPESSDKTWNALERRARYIKKYPHSLIVYKTCVAELEQDKEFTASLQCTIENWKEKLIQVFEATAASYSRHFNQEIDIGELPPTLEKLRTDYEMEFAHSEIEKEKETTELRSERDIRISLLEDLMHNSMTAQKLTSYIPSVAFKMFDAYSSQELNTAFNFYKQNKLISRYRIDVPRRRSIPVSTMTYNLSNTYYRFFEPIMPLRIYQLARSMYVQLRDGKAHTNISKEQDILKSQTVAAAGTCGLNFGQITGGHVAYLTSALTNDKATVEFILPDEMTKCDENHMKKLQQGNLNFQSLVFEQRVRRGESLVNSRMLLTGNLADNASTVGNTRTSTTRNQTDIRKSFDSISSKTQATDSESDEVRNAAKSVCRETFNTGSESDKNRNAVDNVCSNVNSEHSEGGISGNIERKEGNDDVVKSSSISKAIDEGEKSSVVHSSIIPEVETDVKSICRNQTKGPCNKRRNSLNRGVSPPRKIIKKGSFTEESTSKLGNKRNKTSEQKKHGTIFASISTVTTSCSYKETPKDVSPQQKQQQRITRRFSERENEFRYSTDSAKKVRTLNDRLDLLKVKKMHASRTALTMHRSINNKQLVPTNAMNTHDALIINPMRVEYHVRSSPFRTTFTKLKHHSSDAWKRLRMQEDGACAMETLSISEYCTILREDLKYSAKQIDTHVVIIDRVGAAQTIGIKLKDFKVIFSDIDTEVLQQWHMHLQTLVNFRMLYHVGHYDERLVTAVYYPVWCYRAPQVKSNFESTEKKQPNASEISAVQSKVTVAESKDTEGDEKTGNSSTKKNQDSSSCVQDASSSTQAIVTGGSQGTSSSSAQDTTVTVAKEGALFSAEDIAMGETQETASNSKQNTESVEVLESGTSEMSAKTDDPNASDAAKVDQASVSYKLTKVRPWLKLNGELNSLLLKRFQEVVLTYVMINPGAKESQIVKNFCLILKPCAVKSILKFLEINGTVRKHYQQKHKTTLFSTLEQPYGTSFDDCETYYLPTKCALLNMMDMNR